jgi:hypothetical protein
MSSPVTIFPTVRRAGISTEGAGCLNKRRIISLEHDIIITVGNNFELPNSIFKILTVEAQQAGYRHQHQLHLEFCHLHHQKDMKVPNRHRSRLLHHLNE